MRGKRTLEYNVFEYPNASTMSVEITKLVNEGWQLVGGPITDTVHFYQALIREKTAEEAALESGAVKKQNDGSLEFGVEGGGQ